MTVSRRRALRGQLANAVRWKREDQVAELRVQLLGLRIEDTVRGALIGARPLDQDQVNDLCDLIRSYGPETSMVEAIAAMPAEAERLKARVLDALAVGEPLDLDKVTRSA